MLATQEGEGRSTGGSGDSAGHLGPARQDYVAPEQLFLAAGLFFERLLKDRLERSLDPADRSAQDLRFFDAAGLVFSRLAASLARTFAMRSISFTGTCLSSGKRIVPLLTS